MSKVIITSYTDPDLDGFACAVAYAELLSKTGTETGVRFFGQRHVEAVYLLEKFGIAVEEDKATPLDRVILVDASELRDLDAFIKPENVLEIIDHRSINDANIFKNAKIQIEMVGAAATLVAERFHNQKIPVSWQAALLLYGAIISNTLNFRISATTDRDKKMAEWLQQRFKPEKDFIPNMFRAKSDMSDDKLETRIISDFAWFHIGKQKIGIAQLEMMDVAPLIDTRLQEIFTILQKLLKEDNLDKIFISFIDLGEEHNVFCTEDYEMQLLLSDILHISFENNVATRRGYIMRKQIVPLLRRHLEN